MKILFVIKISLLTLLKISYEFAIFLLILLSMMAITVLITEDKTFFTKKYISLKKAIGIMEEK